MGMDGEMKPLEKNETWDLVPLSRMTKAIRI